MKRVARLGVLAAFVLLVVLLAAGLGRDPRALPSALVGKAAPAFDLPLLREPQRRLSPASLRGQVWVLNVWASWCAACRDEHAQLTRLGQRGLAPLVGMAYKDERADALQWLAASGDPYTAAVADHGGRVGIDYGVYGVPETFVIDRRGVVRYRLAGPMSAATLDTEIVPLLARLQRERADD